MWFRSSSVIRAVASAPRESPFHSSWHCSVVIIKVVPVLCLFIPYQIPRRFEVGGFDLEGKVVLVIDVPPEFEGLLPEFVRLDDVEALAVLHLILSILQARGLEGDQQ